MRADAALDGRLKAAAAHYIHYVSPPTRKASHAVPCYFIPDAAVFHAELSPPNKFVCTNSTRSKFRFERRRPRPLKCRRSLRCRDIAISRMRRRSTMQV